MRLPDIAVSRENRQEYVRLYAKYLLEDSIARQFGAFQRGFHAVCGGECLQLFRWEEVCANTRGLVARMLEHDPHHILYLNSSNYGLCTQLELLICGSPVLDFEALERAAQYDDGFFRKHPTINLLWEVSAWGRKRLRLSCLIEWH